MSEPRCAWMSTARSGVSRCRLPSRCERNAAPVLGDGPARAQAEDLVAAAVGEHRPRPADEAVQAAAPGDELVAGPQVEVIGVAQDDFRAEVLEVPRREGLDRPARADRHERRRLHVAVGGPQHAAPRRSVAVRHVEREVAGGHCVILSAPSPSGSGTFRPPRRRRDTTQNRSDLRRPVRRARSLARLGRIGHRQPRPRSVRGDPHPHRSGRPVGTARSPADADRRGGGDRRSARRVRPHGARRAATRGPATSPVRGTRRCSPSSRRPAPRRAEGRHWWAASPWT